MKSAVARMIAIRNAEEWRGLMVVVLGHLIGEAVRVYGSALPSLHYSTFDL